MLKHQPVLSSFSNHVALDQRNGPSFQKISDYTSPQTEATHSKTRSENFDPFTTLNQLAILRRSIGSAHKPLVSRWCLRRCFSTGATGLSGGCRWVNMGSSRMLRSPGVNTRGPRRHFMWFHKGLGLEPCWELVNQSVNSHESCQTKNADVSKSMRSFQHLIVVRLSRLNWKLNHQNWTCSVLLPSYACWLTPMNVINSFD